MPSLLTNFAFILSLCSYLLKLNYKTQDNNQIIYKSKSCRAADFSKFSNFAIELKVGFVFIAIGCLDGSLTGDLGSENPSSSLMVIGVVHSHVLSHFLHYLHYSKLVLCHGYLCHMMFVEIPSHYFHHVPELDWDVHSCQKNSRDCFLHLDLY